MIVLIFLENKWRIFYRSSYLYDLKHFRVAQFVFCAICYIIMSFIHDPFGYLLENGICDLIEGSSNEWNYATSR